MTAHGISEFGRCSDGP